MRIRISIFVIITASQFICPKAKGLTEAEYIKKYKDNAIEQMLVYNIPASITLAQGMLESKCGSSALAINANNHFGIKCHADWNGPYYVYDDDALGEHFRKYASVNDSYKDHAEFLKSRPWYAFLFNCKRTDYHAWAVGLSKAGYATATDYTQQLLYLIEKNHLYNYDTVLQKLNGFGILYGVTDTTQTQKASTPYIIIQSGDCMYKIAREYSIEVDKLCKYNGINIHGLLVPGQRLYLKPRTEEEQQGDSRTTSSISVTKVDTRKKG